ncbi:MAG: SagB/ThcOx family dehydrogenase [Actinobacteria bacterium]|nr:SagB/ThcOx family dehydrogenase [Actinomycetota bacterium]
MTTSPTADFASVVYGEPVADDDPAEHFHEASRLHPRIAPGRLPSLLLLGRSAELQQSAARSSRTHAHRSGIALQRGAVPGGSFRDALVRRRSSAPDEARSISLRTLGGLLEAGYAVQSGRRTVPSGGALYPLELYVVALAVEDCSESVFHYDPFAHRLEQLGDADRAAVSSALVDPSLGERAAAVLVLTAMFWRTRFKYGLRGYRFALLEAGHVVQNVVLAAACADVAALPVGGYYDRRVDALVGADGLDEASVYVVILGGGR